MLAAPAVADAQGTSRGLIAPTTGQPATVRSGQLLQVTVRVASGLTPPPGVQQDRARRFWAGRLTICAPALGAPRCAEVPLRVANVRPLDASGLRYRADLPLPLWVAPGVYDLWLRFPGGESTHPRSVFVPGPGPLLSPEVLESAALPNALVLRPLPPSAEGWARVHWPLARSMRGAPDGSRFYPLPAPGGGFLATVVALVPVRGELSLRGQPTEVLRPDIHLEPARPVAGQSVRLSVPALAGQQVHWYLAEDHGHTGASAQHKYVVPAGVTVGVLVAREGDHATRFGLAERGLTVAARAPAGGPHCGLSPRQYGTCGGQLGLGLLAVALSWRLRRAARSRQVVGVRSQVE